MSDLSFKLMHRTGINGPPVANLDNSCNDIRSRNSFSSFGCTKHIFWLWKRICIWKKLWILNYESLRWLTRNTATTNSIRFIIMSDKINFMFVKKFFRITPRCTWKDHINISTVSQSFISFFICTNCSSWNFFLNFPKIHMKFTNGFLDPGHTNMQPDRTNDRHFIFKHDLFMKQWITVRQFKYYITITKSLLMNFYWNSA